MFLLNLQNRWSAFFPSEISPIFDSYIGNEADIFNFLNIFDNVSMLA